MRHVFLVLLMIGGFLGGPAIADPQEDFVAGMDAYQEGDLIAAMTALKKAADTGHAAAQAAYAYLLDKSDYDEDAVRYYRKSAEQGHDDGMYGLASMYSGGEGVAQDFAEARKWYVKSAEKGHPLAIRVLAEAHAFGGLGLTDAERASPEGAQWIKKSAEEGYVPMMLHLLKLYEKGGQGIQPDATEAAKLKTRLAEMQGANKDAESNKKKRRRFFE